MMVAILRNVVEIVILVQKMNTAIRFIFHYFLNFNVAYIVYFKSNDILGRCGNLKLVRACSFFLSPYDWSSDIT